METIIRHSLKSFGIRLSEVGRGTFDQAVRTPVAKDPLSAELMDAMLRRAPRCGDSIAGCTISS
ncbi:hypothetical protein [Mesorhizobium sp. M0578]|uniref:hypothetical protein n=1 Tax=unclassified Mesorhizobium TaxID=325217 RepID=UPI0033388BCC